MELSPVLKQQVDALCATLCDQSPLAKGGRYGQAFTTDTYATLDVMRELMEVYCARQLGQLLNTARTEIQTYVDKGRVVHVMEIHS
jgi:hypothetical protein